MIARPIILLVIVQLILTKLNTDHADTNNDLCVKLCPYVVSGMRFRTYGTHKATTLQQSVDYI